MVVVIVKTIIGYNPNKGGATFSEFSLLPDGLTTRECTIEKVTLETMLAGLIFKIPLMSAAMMSVTGYELALELARRGGIGVLPNKLPIDVQEDIVKKIKGNEMEFVEEPVTINKDSTIKQALELVDQHGHSTIPIVDKYHNFLGMFSQQQYWQILENDTGTPISIDGPVASVMVPFNKGNTSLSYCENPKITVPEVKELFKTIPHKYLVVIDELGRLVKLAFKQDIESLQVGVAISTHGGWKERVECNIKAGANLIVVDTSDGYNVFEGKVIRDYKKIPEFSKVPICGGNVVTYEGALYLMDAGADIIKGGMSSGSICSTRREKAVGRSPISALIDLQKARERFHKKSKRYVPIIWDGGASSAADFIIALTIADAVMAGGYFNSFYEAKGEKYDIDGKLTNEESKMAYVATWGEGSERGRNEDRYGQSRKTFFPEGEEGLVHYKGRMKPNLERDINKIKAALSNAGCKNLKEYREKAVLEYMSPAAQGIVGDVHSIITKKDFTNK